MNNQLLEEELEEIQLMCGEECSSSMKELCPKGFRIIKKVKKPRVAG